MKNIVIIALGVLMIACNGNTSQEKTSTQTFSELSEEEGFADKHKEPEAVDQLHLGETISIGVDGGEDASIYQIESKNNSNKYLFVIHEWWGLNDHIKMEADKLYNEFGDVNVMALDLYDGKVATTREKAQEYMSEADETRIQNIIDAALSQLPEDAELGTIGWCFGGGWSLRAALQAGKMTKACVMYYGMPITNPLKLEKLNAEVLFIYGTQDQWINDKVAEDFRQAMEEANKEVTILSFDADHAFANPSGEHYLEKAAQEANESARVFLGEKL